MFHTFALPFHLPKTFSCASPMATTASPSPRAIGCDCGVSIKGILYPALSHSNTLYFKSAYNVQIVVGDDEPEDRIVYRFKKEVLKAGVLQECRRRRFFENKHDKIKRKARQASRRNRKRFTFLPLTPRFSFPKKSNYLRFLCSDGCHAVSGSHCRELWHKINTILKRKRMLITMMILVLIIGNYLR